MDKDLKNRLIAIRQNLGLSSRQIALKIGADPSYYAKAEKGGSLSNQYLEELIHKFQIDKSWLYLGENYMYGENNPHKTILEEESGEYKFNEVPYYYDVNASAGLNFAMMNDKNDSVPIKIPNVDAQAYINVFGDSMYPKYCSGEIIGVKYIEKEFVMFGQAYVIQMKDGESYLKYILPGKDANHWKLGSENERYPAKEFHLSKIENVFIIKAVISKITLS